MKEASYESRKPRLLKDFDRSVSRSRPLLLSRYGEERAAAMMRESRREYEALIPQIPYIGDKNPLLVFLLPASRHLAIYRALQRQGETVEAAGRLIGEMSEAELKAMPGIVRRLISRLWFSPWFRGRLRKRAAESQERQYPGGYVLTYVEGDGRSFDYGIDYTECASCKFLSAQGAMELAPYVCAVDRVASEMLGWGLTRTTTIAEGFEKCDFRFKKGGRTRVPTPAGLQPQSDHSSNCAGTGR